MKGIAKRTSEKKVFSKLQTRKPKFVIEDKFKDDIKGKNYHHYLSSNEAMKQKTGIGIEVKNTGKTEYFSQYKKTNKNTGKVEQLVFDSIYTAKIHTIIFEERGIETRLCLYVNGNKLCNLSETYQNDGKIYTFSKNKGLHIFHQNITWKFISAGYVKVSSNKIISNEDMPLYNQEAYAYLVNKIFNCCYNNEHIKKVVYNGEDMLIFETHGEYIIKGMIMTNYELIKKNNKRREKGLKSMTFDPKSSKCTDFYLALYTIPAKWYIEKAKGSVEGIIKEIVSSNNDDPYYILDAKISISYRPIDLLNGISFKEEEVTDNEC